MKLHYFLILSLLIPLIFIQFHINTNPFWARDAQTFRDYTNFESFELGRVPFLYPFVLFIMNLFGNTGIYIIQSLMLGLSGYFITKSVSKKYNYLALVLLCTYPSLLLITSHAISETFCILLLSIFVYLYHKKDYNNSLILLVLLAVTKPIFLYPFLAVLVYYIIKKRVYLNYIITSLIIVFIQVVINAKPYTQMGMITLKQYFMSYYISTKTGKDIDTIRQYINQINIYKVIWYNLWDIITVYTKTIIDNLFVKSNFTMNNILFTKLTWMYNIVFFTVTLLITYKRKLIVPSVLVFYLIIISAVSMFQGDRLVLITIPLLIYTTMRSK